MTWSMSTKCDGSTSSRRGRICGTLTRAKPRSPVSGSRKPTAIDRLSVEMYGNGWPGSTASGVRTGKISSRKRWRSASWCSGMAAYSTSSTPSAASVRRTSTKIAEWSATSSSTRSRAAASCSSAVRPSGERATLPASTCWRRPATRTWKNSSRLPAKMARNLTRSSSGLRSSRASCSTRALNSSHDSSRLMYGNVTLARGGAARTRGDDGACGTGGDAWIDRGHGLVSGLFVGVADVRRPGGRG